MNYWFSSDFHFGHTNVIGYSKRPFENPAVMDETIISNWNDVVQERDECYFLGDFCFNKKNTLPFY